MSREHILVVLAVLVAAWGCGQQQQPPTLSISAADKSRLTALEATVSKLDKELKQVQTVRDSTQALLDQQLAKTQATEKERDGLQANLTAKAAEKDALQGKYDGFRQKLKDLLADAESAPAPAVEVPPVTVVPPPAAPTGSAEVIAEPKITQ